MNWVRSFGYRVACAAFLVSSLNGAMISLDTSGADPDLTSPVFSFMANSNGAYVATFRNVSNPPQDFIEITLYATFSPTFYNMAGGPANPGSSCNPGQAFLSCYVNFYPIGKPAYTIGFDFFGTDATHPGLPYGGSIDLRASAFEPNQTISANAITVPSAATPEPATFGMMSGGWVLLGLGVFRKQLLKFRIAPHRT